MGLCPAATGIRTLDVADELCPSGVCSTQQGGHLDGGHIFSRCVGPTDSYLYRLPQAGGSLDVVDVVTHNHSR